MLDALLLDLRSTMRILAARPGWTIAAILCLAIATGANTAAFTLVNGLLLRALPFDEPDQLVMVALREPTQSSPRPFTLREYRELADQSSGTSMLLARTFFPLSLAADDGARMAQAELVSANYFQTLRVTPVVGRFFDEHSEREGGTPQAVLSHRLWQRRFGGSPAVVGQSMRINGRHVFVVGVAPPGFVGAMQLVAADLWLPAAMYPDLSGSPDAHTIPTFGVMGRLAPRVTIEEAETRLTALEAALANARGARSVPAVIVKQAAGFGVPVAVEGAVLTLSGFIYAVMALLIAVACANVAALVLARGAGRHREIAVRMSLGASRMQIVRQLLTESLVIALAGCAAGTVFALWLTRALVARLTTPFQYVSYAIDVQPDLRVLAYSAAAMALSAVLCGIAPIRVAQRVDVADLLKQSASKGRSRASLRTLNAIVVMQFAVSATLLVAAGLLVRTYLIAQSEQPAFNASGLVASTLDVDQVQLDRAAGIRLYQTIVERLSALPGVTEVALTREMPFRPARPATVRPDADVGARQFGGAVSAVETSVSPSYFRTLGLPLRQGRSFEDVAPPRPRVAVIDEALARRLWPDASPLGRTFRGNQPDAEPFEVIGVVADLTEGSSAQHPQPVFYRPFPHEYASRMTILIRVQGDPGNFFAPVRHTITAVNQDLSVVDLRTMDNLLEDLAGQRRIPATVLTVVGLLGLLLSAVGLFGVVAYSVRERAGELGIRLALGARPADVRRLVLRQGFTMIGIGLAFGATATAALVQVMRSRLFSVDPLDPPTLATVCAVLSAVGFAALYLPARWASRIEPAHTLRAE
jgi:putative ABC transport system permease protein